MGQGPFEYVEAVSYSKNTALLEAPDFEKHYVPFIVNRAFSYHHDTILAANAMNERPWLDKRLQFQFFLNILRPRKRYSKWLKHQVSDDARMVGEYYGCSLRHAVTLLPLHTSDQLTIIRQRLEKGGMASTKGRAYVT
jgi:hypothetical protein